MLARLIILAFLLPLFAGCGTALFECTSAPLGNCAKVETCCDSTECFFEVDDRQFPCDEETSETGEVLRKACDDAIASLEEYCMAR